MKYVPRALERQIASAARSFPALVLTGPRRSGKTFLLRHVFPKAEYHLMEDPDLVGRFRSDPRGFLDGVAPPVILDEVQNVPEVFAYVRSRIDRQPDRKGQWILSGSQEAPLMQGVTESMAGRAAILQLLPMSVAESSRVSPLLGGYPEVVASPGSARLWFSSYLQTYLERDVRAVTAVRDLATFRRFLALVASRHGQPLNRTDLAAPLGISVPTVTQWLGVLEVTAQILIVPPFYENLGKRLVKSPKMFIADSGLACHLLGLESEDELERSPFLGAVFEGFVAGEIVKAQAHSGLRREIYYFRDRAGLEVDFLVPAAGGGVRVIEVKATRTPVPEMARGLVRVVEAFRAGRRRKADVDAVLVYRPPTRGRTRSEASHALVPGVRAVPWPDFAADPLAGSRGL